MDSGGAPAANGGSRGSALTGVLEVRAVSVNFQGLRALDAVTFSVRTGEVLGLIGPNGAGKTTALNVITGLLRPSSGAVLLDGVSIGNRRPDQICRLGVSRTFQNVRLFADLTVSENVQVAAIAAGMSWMAARAAVNELLEKFDLSRVAQDRAGQLSYGDERRLAMARAVAGNPRFLILDEPAAGLNEQESDELVGVVHDLLGSTGCGLLVIEHDMRVITQICDRVHVLNFGRTIAEGSTQEVMRNAEVRRAYLGDADHRGAVSGGEGDRADPLD